IHAVTLPRNMLQHTWSPVMAPAAMNMGSHENITVRPIHSFPKTRSLSAAIHVPIMKGASLALMTTRPSVQNLLMTASSAAQPRAHEHRSPGELKHAVPAPAVDLLVPLALDLFRSAAETLDRQRLRGQVLHYDILACRSFQNVVMQDLTPLVARVSCGGAV